MAKNNSNGIAQGIMVIIFILIYPFVWLYDKLGAGMFWALITILFGGGLAWWGLNTKKKKEQRYLLAQQLEMENARQDAINKQRFNNLATRMIGFKEYRTNLIDNDRAYFIQLADMYHPYYEAIRTLELIIESLQIINNSSNKDTISSRVEVLEINYSRFLEHKSLYFDKVFENINDEIQRRWQFMRTLVYINVATKHLKKADEVVRIETKRKYQNLALEALQQGLTDPEADHNSLQAMIAELQSKMV